MSVLTAIERYVAARATLVSAASIVACTAIFLAGATVTTNDPDTSSYLEPGRNLLERHEFISRDRVTYVHEPNDDAPEAPETFRTPLYPLWLAVMESASLWNFISLVQHVGVLGVAAGIFVFMRGRRGLTGATIAASMFLLIARGVAVTSVASPETFLTITTFAAMLLLIRAIRLRHLAYAAGASICISLAMLTKPIAMFLPIFMVTIAIWELRTRQLLLVVTLLVLPASTWFLWSARNARAASVFTFSSVSGENLLFWRAAGVDAASVHDPLFSATALQEQNDFYLRLRRQQTLLEERTLRLPAIAQSTNHAQRSVLYARAGARTLLSDPLRTLLLTWSGVRLLLIDWTWDHAARAGWDVRIARPLLTVVMVGGLLLALFGIARRWKEDPLEGKVVACGTLYFVALCAGPEAVGRFFFASAPWYAMACTYGVIELAARLRASKENGGISRRSFVSTHEPGDGARRDELVGDRASVSG